MRHATQAILEVGAEFGRKFGRSYGPFDAYRMDDADVVILVTSSTAATARYVLDILRAEGVRAGLIKPHMFRPFPAKELCDALRNVKAVAVMDQAVLFGAMEDGGPYWLRETAPAEFAQQRPSVYTEDELLNIARGEGFDFEYVVRASHDDWDRYEASKWRGLLRWIEGDPAHPERQEVIDHLHRSQEEYLRYGREYSGWAIYLLNPVLYK